PAAQADPGVAVEGEPARAAGARRRGIDGDHLQIELFAEAQQAVVRAHALVPAARAGLRAEPLAHPGDAFLQGGRGDREMIDGRARHLARYRGMARSLSKRRESHTTTRSS